MSTVLNIAMVVHNDAKLALKSITEITKITQRGKYTISVVGCFQDEASLQLMKTLKKDGLIDNLSILNKPVSAAAMANIAWRMTDSPLYLWLPAGMYPKKFHWIDTILSYWRGGLPVSTLCGVESASPDNWPPSEKNKIFKILQKGETGQAAFIPRSVVKVLGRWNEDYEEIDCVLRDFDERMDCAHFPRYAYPLHALFGSFGHHSDQTLQADSVEERHLLQINSLLYNLCIRSWKIEQRFEVSASDEDCKKIVFERERYSKLRNLLLECKQRYYNIENCEINSELFNNDIIKYLKQRFKDIGESYFPEIKNNDTSTKFNYVANNQKNKYRILHDALIMPFQGSMDSFKAGVFDNGKCLDDSLMYRGLAATPMPAEAKISQTCIFGGYMFAHYGHFLLESLSRYYAIQKCANLPLLFLSPNAAMRLWQIELLKFLGIKNEILFVKVPTLVDELLISPAAGDARTPMTDEQFNALGRILPKPPIVGKRIWISRSLLKTGGRIEEEPILEKRLATQGWEIIHPERLSIKAQIKAMMEAEHIACFDGSALYTVLLFQKLYNKFTVFSRRNFFVDFMLEYIRRKGASLQAIIPKATPTTGVGAAQNCSIDIEMVISVLEQQ